MRTFFVVGLPRSRTAWLANLLTYENSHCFHDGLRFCNSFADVKPLFESAGTPIVGNCDSSLIMFLPKMLEIYPDAKVLVINRRWSEVSCSLNKMGLPAFSALSDMFEKFKAGGDSPVIPYEDLSSVDTCEMIWDYLIGTPFNKKRFELLKDLNVQTTIGSDYFDSVQKLMSEV